MDDMPRPRPPYLSREVTRHGRAVWYVRRGGKRIRLKTDYGTPGFDAEYQTALTNTPQLPRNIEPAAGTLAWLVERYRETNAWQNLSLATRRQRENILKHVLASAGDKPVGRITTDTIAAGRDRRSNTPYQARHFLDTMRGLFRWAAKAKHVKFDPTMGVEAPTMPKTEGFPIWTEEQVVAYEKRWPVGTRQRVWLDILLYTGLRRGDAARLGRQHVRDGIAIIKTEKTGTEVTLPVLADTLAAGPCGDLAFICNKTDSRSPRNSSATLSRMRVAQRGSQDQRMGFARLQPRAQQMPVPPSRNSKRSLVGPEDAWHRSTRALRIVVD
jgi:hypothetical protein